MVKLYSQVWGVVSVLRANAQIEYRPEFKDYANSDGTVLVNIDNPETRLSQYHTSDFDRSKFQNFHYLHKLKSMR